MRFYFGLAVLVVALSTPPSVGPASAQLAGTASIATSQGQLSAVAIGYRASKILRSAVYNEQSQKIGSVEDLVVTPRSFVSFVVVSVGGFLGLGKKDVAVPARDFTIINTKVVLPGGTKKALLALPAFHFSRL